MADRRYDAGLSLIYIIPPFEPVCQHRMSMFNKNETKMYKMIHYPKLCLFLREGLFFRFMGLIFRMICCIIIIYGNVKG